MQYNENALHLRYNPALNNVSLLPCTVYEPTTVSTNQGPMLKLKLIEFNVESEESERISVEHVVKNASKANLLTSTLLQETSSASASNHQHVELGFIASMKNTERALQNLRQNIELIRSYVLDVKNGKRPADATILREINEITALLPSTGFTNENSYQESRNQLTEHVFISSYLTALTHGNLITQQVYYSLQISTQTHR